MFILNGRTLVLRLESPHRRVSRKSAGVHTQREDTCVESPHRRVSRKSAGVHTQREDTCVASRHLALLFCTRPNCSHGVYSDGNFANRYVRDFGWELAHPAVSLSTIVARTTLDTAFSHY